MTDICWPERAKTTQIANIIILMTSIWCYISFQLKNSNNETRDQMEINFLMLPHLPLTCFGKIFATKNFNQARTSSLFPFNYLI